MCLPSPSSRKTYMPSAWQVMCCNTNLLLSHEIEHQRIGDTSGQMWSTAWCEQSSRYHRVSCYALTGHHPPDLSCITCPFEPSTRASQLLLSGSSLDLKMRSPQYYFKVISFSLRPLYSDPMGGLIFTALLWTFSGGKENQGLICEAADQSVYERIQC